MTRKPCASWTLSRPGFCSKLDWNIERAERSVRIGTSWAVQIATQASALAMLKLAMPCSVAGMFPAFITTSRCPPW
jgi:hypothetical protein